MAYLTKKQVVDIINNAPANLNKETLLKELSKNNTIEGYNEQQKQPGVLKNIAREIAKPFVQGTELLGQAALATKAVAKAGYQSATGRKEEAKKTITEEAKRIESSRKQPIKLLGGDINRITNQKQAMGSALNLASNFVGGGGVAKTAAAGVKTGVLSAVKAGAKAGAKAGSLYGAGEALSENKNVIGGSLLGAAGGAITGGALPATIGGGIKTAKVITSPFSTAINKVAPALEKAAIKVENVITKPSKTDIAHGFKAENVFKYNLGGGIGQSLQKTESLIGKLVAKAENLRGKSKSTIDLNTIVNSVADELSTGGINKLGMNKKIYNAFKSFVKELEEVAPTGKMNTVDAQKAKVALGKMGSWLNGTKDLDANASETVANALYTKFKVAIENAVDDPAELKSINKQLSEIIPIQNVLLKRIPVAERNSALSLTDIITAGSGVVDPKGWGLFAVNRLSKSGQFAEGLYKGAQKLKSGATKLLPLEVKLKNIKPGLTIEDVSPKGKGEILKTTPLVKNESILGGQREFAKNITGKDKVIEAKAFAKVDKQSDSILNQYFSKEGNIVNTDKFRPFFKDVGYVGYRSASVQEPASELSKMAYLKLLKNKGKYATLYAGGSGTGKTSAVKSIKSINKIISDSSVILDGNLSKYSTAIKRIKEATDAGKKVPIIYIYREPVDSLINGVVKRSINNADEIGRIVPTKVIAENHIGSWNTIKQLYNNGKKDIKLIDNSLGAGKAKKVSFDELSMKIKYPSEEELTNLLNKEIKKLYESKTKIGKRAITENEYKKYIN